jgi:uncharacterized protein with LGFP repeats
MADVSHSRGVQAGDHNTQTNVYLSAPALDLAALSWHGAAEALRKLSRDEAVVALARVPVADVAGILTILLAGPDGLAVSLLAHMNPARARELVAALGKERPWLALLPVAAAAIAECEQWAREKLGERVAEVEHAGRSGWKTEGYRQRHANGEILWSPRGGAHPVPALHAELGGATGRLGFPLTSPGPESAGTRQLFEGPVSFTEETCARFGIRYGGAIYGSEAHGLHAVWGDIGEYYERSAGPGGPLGFPVAAPTEFSLGYHQAAGLSQEFEGGTVYRLPGGADGPRTVAVCSDISDYHRSHGGVSGELTFPLREAAEVVSRYGTAGRYQFFDGGVVYTSAHGAFTVRDRFREVHRELGAGRGHLGLPTSEVTVSVTANSLSPRHYQIFEGGGIFDGPSGTFSVRTPVVDLLESAGLRLTVQLGFPVENERSMGDEDEIVQFFEGGVVTVREGRAEVWISPSRQRR